MLCMVPRSRNGKYTNDKRKGKRERIGFIKAVVPCPEHISKREGKGFQSSPRDRRKSADILLPLWLLLEISLVLVISRSL